MKKISSFLLVVSSTIINVFAQGVTFNGTVSGTPFSLNFGNTAANGSGVLGLLNLAQTIVARLVPFMIGLAVLAFFWFLVQFIWKGDEDPKKHAEGMKGMGYSLIALFAMVSIWGIIAFAGSILSIGQGGAVTDIQMPRAR